MISLLRRAGIAAAVLLGAVAGGAGLARADTGMLGWSDQETRQALDAFVPRLMEEYDVPGVQVAFVRGGRLLYSQGFGVESVWGARPVTTQSLFEAASISKPVAAYTALRLVEGGVLELDRDVGLGLEPPWLDMEEGRTAPRITLRQLLSHQAGFSNNVRRSSHWPERPPGDGFAYSGEGYEYVGYVLEAYEQQRFAEVARKRTLQPLGMSQSGFALQPNLAQRMVRGHVPLWMPLAFFFAPMAIVMIAGTLIALIVVRLVLQQPRLRPGHLLVPAIAGVLAAAFVVLRLVGFGLVGTALVVPFIYVLVVALAVVLWRLVFAVLGLSREPEGTVTRRETSQGPRWQRLTLVLGIASTLPLLPLNIPLPPMGAQVSHPAYSLRTTASDMARFAQEIMTPRVMGEETAALMKTPAVEVGGEISWALGFGVRDRIVPNAEPDGRQRTLWQWGSNAGFENLMVLDPADKSALIVFTNSQNGRDLVQTLAAHVFGGLEAIEEGGGWRLPPSSTGSVW